MKLKTREVIETNQMKIIVKNKTHISQNVTAKRNKF